MDRFRRHTAPLGVVLLLALSLALGTGSAKAVSGGQQEGPLSPRLAELVEPSLGSSSPAQQADALGLAAQGPGSLLREGERILVDVRFEEGAVAAQEELRAAGAEIVNTASRYQTVTVAVKPAQLQGVAELQGVEGVNEVLSPLSYAAPCAGLVTSEGDVQLGAAAARAAFGIDGSGVTVGILSDSFDTDASAPTHAANDVASGDLPGPGNPCGQGSPVSRLDDSFTSKEASDEGRAMAQIVHDIAPGASLAFASAFKGELAFANNIRALAKAGAKVIVDDVSYFNEPFFQDGPIAVAINEVTAAGAAYFSSAGNNNLIDAHGHNVASWEAPAFRDSGDCPPDLVALSDEVQEDEETETGQPGVGLNASHCLDFDPPASLAPADNTYGITVANGATLTIDLQWAEPWQGVSTDLDVYLLDASGKPLTVEVKGDDFLVASLDDNIGSTQRPVEILQWKDDPAKGGPTSEVQLVVNRFAGAMPRLKFALLQNGAGVTAVEYDVSAGGDVVGPTIFGHNGADSAVSLGAVHYSSASALEAYSSRGPVTHYFGPVNGVTPAPSLGPAKVIPKPDIVATDCGLTTFFVPSKTPGLYRFCGTSAAAPHAAAVAALMRQANPSLSFTQMRTALAATAKPVGLFGPDAVGAGLIDASAALGGVALPPVVKVTGPPPPLSRNRSPSIAFEANRPVTFSCSLDGGPLSPCASPYAPPAPLADGRHGFAVRGVDLAGRVGASETVSFTVDTKAPRTSFARKPRKTIRVRRARAKVVFRFRSSEQGSTFVCRFDRGLFRVCKPRQVRRARLGRHVMRVKAVDAAGNADPTPAVFRFRVKQVGR